MDDEQLRVLATRKKRYEILSPSAWKGSTPWQWITDNFKLINGVSNPTIDWSEATDVQSFRVQDCTEAARIFREIVPQYENGEQTVYLVWRSEGVDDLSMKLNDVVDVIDELLGFDGWDMYAFSPSNNWCVEFWWNYSELTIGRYARYG